MNSPLRATLLLSLGLALAACHGRADPEDGPPGEHAGSASDSPTRWAPGAELAEPSFSGAGAATVDADPLPRPREEAIGAKPTEGPDQPSQPGQPTADAGSAAPDAGTPDAGGGATTPDAGTAPSPYLRELWVSTTGSDSAVGDQAAPFRTINKAIAVARPGDAIWVMPGSYRERVQLYTGIADGTAQAPIHLIGIDRPKILPTGASSMVLIARRYWTVQGFDIDAENTNAMGVGFMGGTQGSALRWSAVHDGTAGAGVEAFNGASDVLIEANTIYGWNRGAEDAHGVLVVWNTRNVTVRRNRIYGNSGDSVQCEGPEPYGITDPPANGLLIEGNEMSGDVEQAVDIKTCHNVTIRDNYAHDYNTSMVIHYSPSNVLVEGNLIENVGTGLALGGNRSGPMPSGVVVRRNRLRNVYLAPGNYEGFGFRVNNASQPLFEHNTVLDAATAALRLGEGEGGNTEGLIARGNILGGAAPIKLGAYVTTFTTAANLYRTGATIMTPSGSKDLAAWSAGRGDTTSKFAPAPLAQASFVPAAIAVDAAPALGQPYCGAAPDIGAVETGC